LASNARLPLRRLLVVLGTCLAALGTWGFAAARPPSTAASSQRPILVTRDDGGVPRACGGPRGVARSIENFLDAFNRGDRQRLSRVFGRDLETYAVNEGSPPNRRLLRFSDKEPLLRYFGVRHARRDRITLLIVAAGKIEYLADHTTFSFVLRRSASDLAKLGIFHPLARGKGNLDCRARTISLWVMGMPRDPFVPYPYWPHLSTEACPVPAAWKPSDAIIACG
jgi:hypothetical protein